MNDVTSDLMVTRVANMKCKLWCSVVVDTCFVVDWKHNALDRMCNDIFLLMFAFPDCVGGEALS